MKASNTDSLLLDAENLSVADDRQIIALFPDSERAYFRHKRHLDRLLAAVLLVPGLPLIAVLILLIRLTSRGPGVFRQQRVGKDGRVFRMLKLRSMRVDAEAETGPVWTANGHDPRITRLGRVMRLLHLDELPQLFNVLWGEMSMIGPRPERPEFVNVLRREIPGYMDRLAVQPGVTGLAQINLPADTDLNSVRRKLLLDREQEVATPERLAVIAASRRTACRQAKHPATSSATTARDGNGQPTQKPHPPTPSLLDTLNGLERPELTETEELRIRKAK